MAKRSFVRYATKTNVDPQKVYIENKAVDSIIEELTERGSRRLLVVCDNAVRKLRPFEKMVDKLLSEHYRVFIYCQTGNILVAGDIEGAAKICHEYNCDTIIAVGGMSEIDCAKLVGAMVNNPDSTLQQMSGVNKIKNDIPTVICICTENSVAATTSSAEFYIPDKHQWVDVYSPFLTPHIVVYDAEFSSRGALEISMISAVEALSIAIESYIHPLSLSFPEYRASSKIAITSAIKNLEKLASNPTDAIVRNQIGVMSFYAGLSSRKSGLGYAHMIEHALISKYGVAHGTGFATVLPLVLSAQMRDYQDDFAELARAAHFCSASLDTASAAQVFVDNIRRILEKLKLPKMACSIARDDVASIVNEVERMAKNYSFKNPLDSRMLTHTILMLSQM